MAVDRLLHDLDEAQRRAVTSPAQPLAILAPAGSGKTRVLTRRIAWRVETGDADASHVLALTFTRKAARELRDRLRYLGLRDAVAAGTFHGVAFAQLRGRWADEGREPPGLLVRKSRLLKDIVGEPRGGARGRAGQRGQGAPLTVAQVATEIEWAKARLAGPDGYAEAVAAARRRTPGPPKRIADLYRRYEEVKRRARMVDFDDLLRLCSHHIETDPSFAAAQRWRHRHLFVDEFQDVNPLQLRLLEAWRGDSYDLCVVGDPHQAIYGWNGADAGFLQDFRRLYPPTEVIELVGSYRSTPSILAAAGDVLRAAGVAERTVRARRPDGLAPTLERHASDHDEARAIARAVRDRRGPRAAWSSQAILVRTHGQIPLLAQALRQAGIPHRVRGSDTLLDHRAVREALDLLRRADGPLGAHLPDLAALALAAPPDEAGEDDGATGTHDDGSAARDRAELDLVVELAHDHLRLDSGATTTGFLTWLTATFSAEGGDGWGDAVTLATFHAAKGLEWPVVHLAGLEDGFVPIAHARTAAERAEEARLLYVAMTRAEDELRGSWAAHRTFGDRASERRLTPWLAGLAERGRAPAPPAEWSEPPADWRQRLAGLKGDLAGANTSPAPPARAAVGAEVMSRAGRPATAEALHALLAWREEQARAARVEPVALVDDHLLEAIAEARPSTTDELAAIPGMGPLLAGRIGPGLLAALSPVG
ncbi:MAG TPA: UvrD-helicase domain-containing protein [Acidimicrobiales bacterium]|nr:UvrD-helicase domain-containing protein [Acidimicrobiales bacterium]